MTGLEVLGIAAVTALVAGIIGFIGGRMEQAQKPFETEAGTVQIEWGYTCHPEAFFDQLERDIAVLNSTDRVRLKIEVTVLQGWNHQQGKKHWSGNFGPIEGSADQVVEVAKALLMDDDSLLVHKNRRQGPDRQRDFLIRKWGKRTGLNSLSWADSDSPLHITVSGTVRAFPPPETTSGVDPERQAADDEVDRLGGHQAALRAQHTETR